MLFTYNSDPDVSIGYTMGSVSITGIKGIVKNEEVVSVTDETGEERKVKRLEIVISRDEDGPWKGVSNPQLKATWTIDGRSFVLDNRDGFAVQAKSATFNLIALIESKTMGKASSGYRIRQ